MPCKFTIADKLPRFYFGADVLMRLIRKYACEVAERFEPDKIILIGSFAHGTLNADSDVDMLVATPCQNQRDQAARISLKIDPPFSLDLIVRTPSEMKWRLEERESFTTEMTTKGKVWYEKNDWRKSATRQKEAAIGTS